MKVNAVNFTSGVRRKVTAPMGQGHSNVSATNKTNIKTADMVSISGLLGASLLSVYFIKRGN